MARRRNPARTVTKLAPTGGAVFTAEQVAGLLNAAGGGQLGRPLPRTSPVVPFAPGVPLFPAPINPLNPQTGRAEPRQYEYAVATNLPGMADRLIPWKVLRDAADRIGLFRRCIEIRKAEVATLEWGIVVSKRAVHEAAADSPGTARADVEQQLHEQLSPQIRRLTAWWEQPDRRNGLDWISWAKRVLEERFVLDAVAVYPRRTLGGDLYSFEVLDGSTIKPLIDQYGGRPMPPDPAYQQVLYGFPRGEFVADTDDDGAVLAGYQSDRLIYHVSNSRTFTPYGYSAVEQALEDGDLYLRRHGWMKAEYTDGVMPAGWLLSGEGQADWSPTQLAEYERAFNDYYAGATATRQRFRILPYGMTPDQRPDIGEKYRPDYDLHLIKLVAAHFDTTLPELGFSEAKGLGSDGWHEGQADAMDRKATQPTLRELQTLVTRISRTYLGMPAELEFQILGLEAEDEDAADEVADRRVKSGRMTLNEDRDRQGLPRYAFAEADMPMLVTQKGIVFVEGASEGAAPGELIQPGGADPEPGAEDGEGDTAPAGPGKKPQAKPAAGQDKAKAAELVAYRRWARKGGSSRPFRFERLTADEAKAAGVDPARAVFKAGDAGPKAWPGWDRDLEIAHHYAPQISQALTGAVPAHATAAAWLEARKTADRTPSQADAYAWLGERGYDITEVLTEVIQAIWTEGYLLGDRAAATLIAQTGTAVDWAGWTPGDAEAAREVLGAEGRGEGLEALLSRAGVVVKSIAEGRLSALAEPLAQALDEGWSVQRLAGVLADVLDDPQWAELVAVTETNRAQSAATLNQYRENGVPAKEWLTALDDRVCRICSGNQDDGAIGLGSYFSSGDDAPPGHPDCRCALGPAWDITTTTTARAEEDL